MIKQKEKKTNFKSKMRSFPLFHNNYNIRVRPDAILSPRALDRRLQEDWARDAKEAPRVLMSLRVDFRPMDYV